jgi:hypothetical protein
VIPQQTDIRSFLCARSPLTGIDFCLPQFGGSLRDPVPLADSNYGPFGYPSSTFAERDAKSALHIMHAVSGVVGDDAIEFTGPVEFMNRPDRERIAFVFGSRSNDAARWLLERAEGPPLIRFEFGEIWKIIGADGKTFSIPDPSALDRDTYSEMTDYGVVARLTIVDRGGVFLVAGLGGRATEGCGVYLSRHWAELHQSFGEKDFAVVLEFLPPVTPERHKPVAWYA